MEELINKLTEKGLQDGIKPTFIEDKRDYFRQAVTIIAGLPDSDETERLMTDIDLIFMNEGYKPLDFVKEVAIYKQELEDLYKRYIRG